MDIKEFLLEGGVLSMAYKANKEDWVGSVTLYIFEGGFGMRPKITMNGDLGWHEFDIEMIDVAIEFFKAKVFCRENLWYKHNEALRRLSKDDPSIDLEEEADWKLVEDLRLRLIDLEINGESEI